MCPIDNRPTEKPIGMISWGAGKTSKKSRGSEESDDVFPCVGEGSTGVDNQNNDAVIVEMMIAKYPIKRIMVDNGSSPDILSTMPL